MAFPDCDLREHPPRRARQMLGGLYFLARTIDKMRAKQAGTIGPYKIGPGISIYLFEGLGITEEQFAEAVRTAKDDADVVAWVHAHSDQSKYGEINEMLFNRKIRDEEHLKQVLPAYPILNDHPGLRNWFDIFDLDDEWMYKPENRATAIPGSAS